MTSLHVDTGREWRGGQGQVLHLVRGLSELGDRAILVTPPASPLLDRARAAGLDCRTLPLRGEWDHLSALALARILGEVGADIVHAHTAHAVTLAGVAARLAGRAVRVVAARRVDFPVSRLGALKLRYLSDVVICVSKAVADVLQRCRVPQAHLRVVHSGIELGTPRGDRARVRAELDIGERPLIGAIGALVAHKDHATLVAAARIVAERRPDASFVIAGAGPLALDLARAIHEAGLDAAFHLLGFRADIADVRAALDVFVLPSKLEGLGTTVLDAMAEGLPIVATRTGGVPEMITDGVEGLLVPPGEAAMMGTALLRLLDDPPLALALAGRARARVDQQFSSRHMVAATRAVYAGLLSEARPT